jgi:hypothetical protein
MDPAPKGDGFETALNAAMGPVCGLTMPTLTVPPAARTGLVSSVGAASAVAAPVPKALMILRRDGCFGSLSIVQISPRSLLPALVQ